MIEKLVHFSAAILLVFFILHLRKYLKSFKSNFMEFGIAIIIAGLLVDPFYEILGYNIMIVGIVVVFFGILRVFKNLKEIAIRDYLTGLYTRYYFFEEWLPQEMERQKRRKGKGIAFLVIDLDDFKIINDRYSHKMGDKVLKFVAQKIVENIRKTDCAVRFGGDEILVAFPEADEKTVENIVKRLEKKLLFNPFGLPLKFSYGVETWKPGEDIESVVQRADLQMYSLKSLRKQRQILSGEEDVD
ncbi:diguanylate cyclase [Thermotoga sp. SG1]|nr:diguanylate cyclase [Thermotoga sp. SG1]